MYHQHQTNQNKTLNLKLILVKTNKKIHFQADRKKHYCNL
jgi:hypothetical protein